MSRIVAPSKPSWRITIDVDGKNQASIKIEDMERPNIPGVHGDSFAGPVPPRQMNQFQLALLLNSVITNILAATLQQQQRGVKTNAENP